jgi:hypothetical protein
MQSAKQSAVLQNQCGPGRLISRQRDPRRWVHPPNFSSPSRELRRRTPVLPSRSRDSPSGRRSAQTARPARGLRGDTAARDLPPSPRCSRVPMTAAAIANSRRSRLGCVSSVESSHRRARPPRRPITVSNAGPRSPASSTTAACACPTMPLSEDCAASRSDNWTFAGSDEGGRRSRARGSSTFTKSEHLSGCEIA